MAVATIDAEELRDMFANLLARSMDTATAGNVHPSFVEVIKQLTPDEARILSTMDRDATFYDLSPHLTPTISFPIFKGVTDLYVRASCKHLDRVDICLDNLMRQRLVAFANADGEPDVCYVNDLLTGTVITSTSDVRPLPAVLSPDQASF